jgi:DNA modification methylase
MVGGWQSLQPTTQNHGQVIREKSQVSKNFESPMKIEQWPIDKPQPYARNARKISDLAIEKVARSIKEFGWQQAIVVDGEGVVIAGHTRLLAAKKLGEKKVPVCVAADLTPEQVKAYRLADNRSHEEAEWDLDMLGAELFDLKGLGFDLGATAFDEDELSALLTPKGLKGDEDEVPEPPKVPVSQRGQVWLLGRHRLMCGDSTSAEDVAKLMAGDVASLLHADPPYGMGKEADGVLNDNIYGAKLDAFQIEWWKAFRPKMEDNGSAYIWGNAPDLWRLWYVGGLGSSEKLELRNQIVWDKQNIAGMKSPELTQYPTATEHCLFFQFGSQFLGNINSDDYPEAWETVRRYLANEAEAAAIKPADVKRVCGCGMYAHWFTRSQFTLITAKHYEALAAAYPGRFTKPWAELKADWNRVKGSGRDVINGKLEGMRSYFDNAHDIMRDVWTFPRVVGAERHGHATPKPVAMIERIVKSSLPKGGILAEPFGGSGSTLIACEKAGRQARVMELDPVYVDVTITRWEQATGKKAILADDGLGAVA